MEPNWKPSRTARQIKKRDATIKLKTGEDREKRKARARDLHRCRFPLCGCRRLVLPLEVSHDQHKGMGGDPTGDRSLANVMTLFCRHRHQFGAVSRHKGTMRTRYLTSAKANGPLAFDVDLSVGEFPRAPGTVWFEVARESKPQVLEPLTFRQRQVLNYLAEMEL